MEIMTRSNGFIILVGSILHLERFKKTVRIGVVMPFIGPNLPGEREI